MIASGGLRSALSRAWPHLRAILICLHIVAVILYALPSPYRIDDRGYWQQERTQDEIRGWAQSLSAIGIDTTPEGLESFLWDLSQGYIALRRSFTRPFEPYRKYGSIAQGWRMFATPQRRPTRLHISLRYPDGREEDLFIPHSDDADWRRHQFEHNRFRKQLGRLARDTPNRDFDFIASWAARMAAAEFPEASTIRVRLYRWRSLSAADVRAGRAPEGRYERERALHLEPLR